MKRVRTVYETSDPFEEDDVIDEEPVNWEPSPPEKSRSTTPIGTPDTEE